MATPFSAAMKKYFGFKDGQTLSEFGAELKALSDADKSWFHAELNRIGVDCDPPVLATKG